MSLRKTTLAIAAITLIGCGAAPAGQSEAFSDSQKEEIGEIVRDYLTSNPEVLQEMIVALEEKQQEEAAELAAKGIKEHGEALFNPEPIYIAGNPNGDVTIVEFFDYRCGYCRGAVVDLQKLLDEDPNVRLVLKEYPVLGPASLQASQAAIAAGMQGKYVEFHWALMSLDQAITEESIFMVAGQIGLDVERMKKDMESDDVAEKLGANIELARALGINGTPNFVIGEDVIPGAIPYSAMVELVGEARKADES